DDRDEERIDGDVQSTILPHRVSWFSRARNIDRRRETRHEPLEPLGRGTEHRSGGVILCGDRDNRDVSLAGNLLDPCDPVSGLLGHRSESLGDRRPYARRGGGRTDPELRPGSTRHEGHLRGREKPDLLGVDRVSDPRTGPLRSVLAASLYTLGGVPRLQEEDRPGRSVSGGAI